MLGRSYPGWELISRAMAGNYGAIFNQLTSIGLLGDEQGWVDTDIVEVDAPV